MAEPDLGEGPCSDATTQCADTNTVCSSNQCTCSATHYDDNGATTGGGSCVQSICHFYLFNMLKILGMHILFTKMALAHLL